MLDPKYCGFIRKNGLASSNSLCGSKFVQNKSIERITLSWQIFCQITYHLSSCSDREARINTVLCVLADLTEIQSYTQARASPNLYQEAIWQCTALIFLNTEPQQIKLANSSFNPPPKVAGDFQEYKSCNMDCFAFSQFWAECFVCAGPEVLKSFLSFSGVLY